MAANPLGLDPKHFTYLKSDDKSTTLKHKGGHLLTVAHSVLSPKMQAVLKAMKPKEASEEEPQEKAKGGYVKEVHPDKSEPGYTSKPKMAEGGLTPGGTPAEYGMPCLNPNCKSQGRPHPNCRCYGFATGGRVGSVCEEKREHHPDCQYYADGGTAQTPEQQESQKDTEQAANQAYDKFHGQSSGPQQATMDPRTWWNKGGEVENKTIGTLSGKPFAKGGEARKMYADQDEPVASDDSAPTQDYGPKGFVSQEISNALDTLNNHFKRGGKSGEAKYAREERANPSPTSTSGENTPPMIYPPSPEQNQQDQQRFNDMSTAFDPTSGQPTPSQMQPPPPNEPNQGQPDDAMQQQPIAPAPQPPPQQQSISKTDELTKQLNDEALNVSKDFKNGHITPKTYSDLLYKDSKGNEKGTLGKIGAAFGLLLSGAGSGLSHQPNVLLEMMNKTIDNDLQAQKASKEGQTNFLRLNQEHIRDNAYKAQTGAYTGLLQAQTTGAGINNEILATQLAKNQMMLGAVNRLYGYADNLPPGPAKTNATAAAQGVEEAAHQHIQQSNARTAAAMVQNEKAEYDNKIRDLRTMSVLGDPNAGHAADDIEAHHFPGSYNRTSQPVESKDRDYAQSYQTMNDMLNRAINMANASPAEKLSYKYRQAAGTLHTQLMTAIKNAQGDGVFKPSEAEQLNTAIGPTPASLLASWKVVPKLKELQEEKKMDYNNLRKKYELPTDQPATQTASPQSTPQVYVNKKTGQRITYQNGKWVPYGQ